MSAYNLAQCNPSTLKTTKTTCLPEDMLERLRVVWNTRFPNHKIPASIKRKESLWRALRERMSRQYECASEYCAVQQLGADADKSSAARYFRPKKPANWEKDPTEWHDTLTIANVLEQYEEGYPEFEFIGPVPIDFDTNLPGPGNWGKCIADELCRLNLAEMRNQGKKFIGIVFNLDPHDRPGSHWICAYIDLDKNAAYYYDSYGYEPPTEIKRLLRRCWDQGIKQIFWNDIRHQRRNTECGTYCMYVIISLLKGRPFGDLCKNRINDETMNAVRDVLYATEKPRPAAIREAANLLINSA
jgi:hypothetical protein